MCQKKKSHLPNPTIADLVSVIDDINRNQLLLTEKLTEKIAPPVALPAPHKEIKLKEVKSVLDEVLGRFNRETIMVIVLVYEIIKGGKLEIITDMIEALF